MKSKPDLELFTFPFFPEMINIPAGKFIMGSSDYDPFGKTNEKPQHIVDLHDYWISRYPVTNKQFGHFLDAQFRDEKPLINIEVLLSQQEFYDILTQKFNLDELKTVSMKLNILYDNLGGEGLGGKARELILYLYRNDRLFDLQQVILRERELFQEEIVGKLYELYGKQNTHLFESGFENHPVILVSFEDAKAYCIWLSNITNENYRLPTEQEWEKAARGSYPNSNKYTWGDSKLQGACNTLESNIGTTTPVDQYETINISQYNVVDMLGNVWEWTSSQYKQYTNSPHFSAQQDVNEQKVVVRGGCWKYPEREARISSRGRYPPKTKNMYLGFRIVKD